MGRSSSAVAEKTALALTATRGAWVAMLSAAARIASKGKPIPIFTCAHVQATGAGVDWWVTDGELWRGGVLEIDGIGTALDSGLLPVARALAMLKTCPDGPVRIVFGEGDVKVSAGGFMARIPSFPMEDYPVIPVVPVEGGVSVPRVALARVIAQTLPVVTHDSSKYFMRGAQFQVTANTVTCCSTDGHQLARSTVPTPTFDAAGVEAVIPKGALAELAALLEASEESDVVCQSVDEKHIFRAGRDVLITRAIDDKFPAVDRIIPKTHVTSCVANRADLLGVVRRVSLAADQKTPRVDVSIEGDGLVVTAKSADRGDATERMAVTATGPAAAFALNSNYLENFLQTADTEDVTCDVKDELSPLVFKSVEAVPYLFVIMGMRA